MNALSDDCDVPEKKKKKETKKKEKESEREREKEKRKKKDTQSAYCATRDLAWLLRSREIARVGKRVEILRFS